MAMKYSFDSSTNLLTINGVVQPKQQGIYILGGYDLKDTDKNGYIDSYADYGVTALAYYMVSKGETGEVWNCQEIQNGTPSVYNPETTQESSGGYPPELLEIEREKVNNSSDLVVSNLFSTFFPSSFEVFIDDIEGYVDLNSIDVSLDFDEIKLLFDEVLEKFDFTKGVSISAEALKSIFPH